MLAKDEGRRSLGSFKSLGGTYAGLRTLAREAGTDVAGLLDPARLRSPLPALLCASDGNHGLAVATAARLAGARARVFLHEAVPAARADRIAQQGAEIVRIAGTYDDAVDAAADAALAGDGLLIADTSVSPFDPVVADVMAGYGVIAAELRRQVDEAGHARPTHLFVQAGVGGLAAAMAAGLEGWMAPPARVVVVEPEAAACVVAGMVAGRPERVRGDLLTAAEMLSCGEASASALAMLQRHRTSGMAVPEAAIETAPELLRAHGGPDTTPSGAAGLAGLVETIAAQWLREIHGLGPDSRVALIVSEAPP